MLATAKWVGVCNTIVPTTW